MVSVAVTAVAIMPRPHSEPLLGARPGSRQSPAALDGHLEPVSGDFDSSAESSAPSTTGPATAVAAATAVDTPANGNAAAVSSLPAERARRSSINNAEPEQRGETGGCCRCCGRCGCCGCWTRLISGCRKRNFVLVKAIAAIAVHLGIGVLAFVPFIESWGCEDGGSSRCTDSPVIDALYFAVVTLTTVGYGDIVPAQPWAKVFVCGYIVFGLTGIMLLISNAANFLLTKQQVSHCPHRPAPTAEHVSTRGSDNQKTYEGAAEQPRAAATPRRRSHSACGLLAGRQRLLVVRPR